MINSCVCVRKIRWKWVAVFIGAGWMYTLPRYCIHTRIMTRGNSPVRDRGKWRRSRKCTETVHQQPPPSRNRPATVTQNDREYVERKVYMKVRIRVFFRDPSVLSFFFTTRDKVPSESSRTSWKREEKRSYLFPLVSLLLPFFLMERQGPAKWQRYIFVHELLCTPLSSFQPFNSFNECKNIRTVTWSEWVVKILWSTIIFLPVILNLVWHLWGSRCFYSFIYNRWELPGECGYPDAAQTCPRRMALTSIVTFLFLQKNIQKY